MTRASKKRADRSIRRSRVSRRASKGTRRVRVENVNHPGQVKLLDAGLYEAMKLAFLKTVPKTTPGLTLVEIERRLIAHLPEALFPKGEKAGWWAKTVQLDLEAKGVLVREKTTPLRLHRA